MTEDLVRPSVFDCSTQKKEKPRSFPLSHVPSPSAELLSPPVSGLSDRPHACPLTVLFNRPPVRQGQVSRLPGIHNWGHILHPYPSTERRHVKFKIGDAADQERYHSLAPMYYRDAAGAIIVSDTTGVRQMIVVRITTAWEYGANQFVKMFPDKVIVHCSESNMHRLTLDGVDVMGERLAEEVVKVINRRPGLTKISFIAHSVGGLVARYAIGRLYRPHSGELPADASDGAQGGDDSSRGTICGLEAMNFITVATPHLGSRGNKQVPFLFGVTAIEKVAASVIHWIFRRTGKHLFLTDNDEGQPPLLQRMVDDHGDLYFMSALRAFKRRVAYSNVGYDHIVGWRTSSIRRNSELPKWEDSLSEEYPHVVYEERSKAVTIDQCEQDSDVSGDSDEIEEELVTGLSRVSWEKVDVSFHASKQRFAAHSVIQVKYHFMHSEGADVIKHMIDHFHT